MNKHLIQEVIDISNEAARLEHERCLTIFNSVLKNALDNNYSLAKVVYEIKELIAKDENERG